MRSRFGIAIVAIILENVMTGIMVSLFENRFCNIFEIWFFVKSLLL